MKILVTGGAGFIGSHVVDQYLQLGHQVLVIDDLSTGRKENLNSKAEFYQMDIRSQEAAELVQKEKPEVFNHHAAQMDVRKSVEDPQFDADVNIRGLLNLMEAFKKAGSLKRTIFASTGGAIYGDADEIPTPETYPARPICPYGISKLSSEHYLYYYQQIFDFPYTILRYGNVYGPRQNPHGEAGVVAIFTRKMLKNEPAVINGAGEQTRDFIYVEDVARANRLALEKDINGVFNIGTGQESDVNTIFKILQTLTNTQIEEKHGPARKGEQQRSCLDAQLAEKKLAWQAETDLKAGLEKTVSWFKANAPKQ